MSAPDKSLDDIFGSSPPEQSHTQPRSLPVEPSELPSLRRQHVTAGYRDGLSTSKSEHVQHGFDDGFPVGAQLGMRAGTILGIIEGILRGYESSTVVKKPSQKAAATPASTDTEANERKQAKRDQILRVYRQAVKELNVQAVFAGVDGRQSQIQRGEGKPQDQLLRKGDDVLAKWENRVFVAGWEENALEALETKSDTALDGPDLNDSKGVVTDTAGQS
ncbi:hypothetical protein BJX99DRAFT_238436 [Aspergillus californicus]